jgi:hypothetical protein
MLEETATIVWGVVRRVAGRTHAHLAAAPEARCRGHDNNTPERRVRRFIVSESMFASIPNCTLIPMIYSSIGLGLVKSRYVVKMETFTVTEFGLLDATHPSSKPLDR